MVDLDAFPSCCALAKQLPTIVIPPFFSSSFSVLYFFFSFFRFLFPSFDYFGWLLLLLVI